MLAWILYNIYSNILSESFFLSLMQIQKCELVLIHTYPVGEDSLVSDRPKKEVSMEVLQEEMVVSSN